MSDFVPSGASTLPAMAIRALRAADVPDLVALIDSTGLFPGELLPDMVAGYLDNPAGDDRWLVVDDTVTQRPVAVAYVAPERLTSGTWNLYLIAVHAQLHGQGIGARLLRHVEDDLRARGARVLLVETSGLPAFERTRRFYLANGYREEARIREFYAAGEDKVVFWKAV